MEHANDDERTYYLMEKESLVNRYISVPKDKGSLNCAVYVAGIVEAVLTGTGFVSIYNLKFYSEFKSTTKVIFQYYLYSKYKT